MNSSFKKKLRAGLLVSGILLIAFNMRPSIATVGPLVQTIRQDTGFSNSLLGLLTTLPVLTFGMISMFISLVTKRLGLELTLAAALILLIVGTLMRIFASISLLLGGTLVLGAGIAFINVLLPSIIKRDFPHHSGLMTSLYTAMLGLGASLAAGIALPIADRLNWHYTLGIWALPAVLALLMWLPQLTSRTLPKFRGSFASSLKDLGTSKTTWYIAFFMGMQSLVFYAILAWLPDILQTQGFSASKAGLMLSVEQGAGIAGSLVLPYIAGRLERHHKLVSVIFLLDFFSVLGIMLPVIPFKALWAILLGFSLGGSLGVAILFMVRHASNTETASELTGFTQSIGYLLAAGGPTVFGFLHDLNGSYFIPMIFLLCVIVIKLLAGLGASEPGIIK